MFHADGNVWRLCSFYFWLLLVSFISYFYLYIYYCICNSIWYTIWKGSHSWCYAYCVFNSLFGLRPNIIIIVIFNRRNNNLLRMSSQPCNSWITHSSIYFHDVFELLSELRKASGRLSNFREEICQSILRQVFPLIMTPNSTLSCWKQKWKRKFRTRRV